MRGRDIACALAAWLVAAVFPAFGQDDEPAPAVEERRAELVAEIDALESQLDAIGDEGAVPEHLVSSLELLRSIERVLGQREAEAQVAATREAERVAVEAALESLIASGPREERPWSFELLEDTRDELGAEEARRASLERARDAALEGSAEAQRTEQERGAALRQAREALEQSSDETQVIALERAAQAAERSLELARERARLAEAEHENRRLDLELHEERLELLTKKLAWLEPEVEFDEDERARRVQALEREAERLRLRASRVDVALDEVTARLMALEDASMDAGDQDPGLAAERAGWKAVSEFRTDEKLAISRWLEQIEQDKEAWDRRYRVARELAGAAELIGWKEEAEKGRRSLVLDVERQEDQLAELQRQLGAAEGRVAESLADRIALFTDHLERLGTSRQLHERLLVELESGSKLGLNYAWTRFRKGFADIWNYELASIQDSSITVGKLVTVLILLTFGVWASRVFSRLMGGWLLRRFGVDAGAAAAIQAVLFYVLILTCALFALRVVNVPLTVFTVLGGALAIGVGFGSQNVVSNFISGLILLAERPISVGNMVQLGDLNGVVEHIGARSTRVRTGDNIEIIVPNSSFLENNVVNWTLTDSKIRVSVAVGVAYGSPVREVSKILLKAADDHGQVLNSPERPFVLFEDFGSDALVFSIHFWIHLRRLMDRRRIASDLRFLIESRFNEAGIVIAFPQRDVHLDTTKPLDVRVVQPEESGPALTPE